MRDRLAILLMLLVVGGVGALCAQPASAAEPTTAPATAPASALTGQQRQALVGQWLRPDGGYILSIAGVGVDGVLDATYLNPKPIHISKAQALVKDGKLALFVELRDNGYPGNFYILLYDPEHDTLSGLYRHLGIGQDFDVAFQHIDKAAKAKD